MIEKMAYRTGRELSEQDIPINTADIAKAQMGGFGAHFISDAVAHTPGEGFVFVAVQAIKDCVVAAYAPAFDGNSFTGKTIPAGQVIPYRFTSITLTSGEALAYKGL